MKGVVGDGRAGNGGNVCAGKANAVLKVLANDGVRDKEGKGAEGGRPIMAFNPVPVVLFNG